MDKNILEYIFMQYYLLIVIKLPDSWIYTKK